MKIIDLLNKIANDEEVPKQIKAIGMIWTFVEGFGQYQNSNYQDLIKYLRGDYDYCKIGLVYKALLNYEVEMVEGDEINEGKI